MVVSVGAERHSPGVSTLSSSISSPFSFRSHRENCVRMFCATAQTSTLHISPAGVSLVPKSQPALCNAILLATLMGCNCCVHKE